MASEPEKETELKQGKKNLIKLILFFISLSKY